MRGRFAALDVRLATLYAIALTIALVAFAAFALAVLDRAQTSALDDRLLVAARATSAFANERERANDPIDTSAFARLIGVRVSGALLGPRGNLVASTTRELPDGIVRASDGSASRPQTLGRGEDAVRVVRLHLARTQDGVASIVLWTPLANVGDLVRRVALVFAFAIPAIVFVSFALGRLVARRGLRPLHAVVSLAAEIEATDLSRRLRLGGTPGELGELCATFDRMLDRLQAAFERERRFSADASHELRAPLSILRAEAELALSRERSGDAYRAALASIVVEADALEALTRDLLRAARTDDGDMRPVALDLAALVERAAGFADRLAIARGISIVRALVPAVIAGDSAALERALLALFDNAIKHARDAGAVRVAMSATPGAVEVTICDDGAGFTAEALRSATERFWRDRSDRARGGTGLGLAIARASIEASSGTLALENGRHGGACVRVRFPIAL